MRLPRRVLDRLHDGYLARRLLPATVLDRVDRSWARACLADYSADPRPAGAGYALHREAFLGQALGDARLIEAFRSGTPLPKGYGVGVDERCVEFPWMVAHLPAEPAALLDAGSTCNHALILDLPIFRNKTVDIVTLAPEPECHWRRGVSYLFRDLRALPLRDELYDLVTCISTLEHVGCDNYAYSRSAAHREDRPDDFLLVMGELARVLRAGGRLLLTVPFGADLHYGWFRQFDRSRLERAIAAFPAGEVTRWFYRYTAEGWDLASAEDCARSEYVRAWNGPPERLRRPFPIEPDRAVNARAVACVRLMKPPSRPERPT